MGKLTGVNPKIAMGLTFIRVYVMVDQENRRSNMRKGSKKIQDLLIKQGCVWVDGKGWETDGDVDLSGHDFKILPTFSRVGGGFGCYGNKLVSLAGAPTEVGGGFGCDNNQLVSLAGAPTKVGRDFWCYNNCLITLEGAPTEVGGDFGCSHNQLSSLAGAPKKVGGNFGCHGNKLIFLTGAPTEIGRDFWCDLAIKAHPAFDIYWHFVKNGMPELAAKTAAEIKI
jgi:hypothetical protein